MNIVDLLVTIVVVTILVTIVLAIVTYIAYKLRLAREPHREDLDEGPRYFVPYPPPNATSIADGDERAGLTAHENEPARGTEDRVATGSAVAGGTGLEGHAAEA